MTPGWGKNWGGKGRKKGGKVGKWWRNGRKRQKKPFKLGQKREKKGGKSRNGERKGRKWRENGGKA